MSGAGRRTIHRETGSGGWPNGLTVDYLEKRILWIDARSALSTNQGRGSSTRAGGGAGTSTLTGELGVGEGWRGLTDREKQL